ncbi:MAG: hypothetical protein V8Q30_04430 [Acutalibacteraceae bacterium]
MLVNAPNLNPMYFEGAVFWCFLITVYLGVYAVFRYGEIMSRWAAMAASAGIRWSSPAAPPKSSLL